MFRWNSQPSRSTILAPLFWLWPIVSLALAAASFVPLARTLWRREPPSPGRLLSPLAVFAAAVALGLVVRVAGLRNPLFPSHRDTAFALFAHTVHGVGVGLALGRSLGVALVTCFSIGLAVPLAWRSGNWPVPPETNGLTYTLDGSSAFLTGVALESRLETGHLLFAPRVGFLGTASNLLWEFGVGYTL